MSVIQKCLCFIEQQWKRANNTQPTGKNWPGKVAGGEELDSLNSICVFHTAWTLFVHATQYISSIYNKSLSTKLGKIKIEKLKIHRFILWLPSDLSMFHI